MLMVLALYLYISVIHSFCAIINHRYVNHSATITFPIKKEHNDFVPKEEKEMGIINHRYVNHSATITFPIKKEHNYFVPKEEKEMGMINHR